MIIQDWETIYFLVSHYGRTQGLEAQCTQKFLTINLGHGESKKRLSEQELCCLLRQKFRQPFFGLTMA